MKLCLLVSRHCNYRCAFCRVEFTDRDMSWDVARRAVDVYLKHRAEDRDCVKFFGGEPLHNWEVVRRLIDEAPDLWPKTKLRFELATNGAFLDDDKIAFFRAHPETEVTVSFPAPGAPRIPGVCYTMVLDRRTTTRQALAQMRSLLKEGYVHFNFLPAYYAVWSAEEARRLRLTFAAVAGLLGGLWERGKDVRVRNMEIAAPVPLYNSALTADTDGSLYASNVIQSEGAGEFKRPLRVGDVSGAFVGWEEFERRAGLLPDIMARWAGPKAWRSTLLVDRLLDEFVADLVKRAARAGRRAPD